MKSNANILDWLNFKSKFDYSKNRLLGQILGALVFGIGVLVVLGCLLVGVSGIYHLVGAFLGIGRFAEDADAVAMRNIGLLLVAVFGAPLLLWRAIVAQKQVSLSQQGQITDRISPIHGDGLARRIG